MNVSRQRQVVGDVQAVEGFECGLIWRPGFYDDLIGVAVTWAEPVTAGLKNQTSFEAFYRLDVSDNLALTADVQYLNNPGFNANDPLVLGLRLRFNL